MTADTPIDTAHAAMTRAAEDAHARLRFYERVAESELFLLLSAEPTNDRIEPAVFDLPEGRFVLAFDREERLAQFASDIVPHASLSGRVLAGMLAAEGLGLGLNLDVAPSAILIPDDAITWLATTLSEQPQEVATQIEELSPPVGLPEALIEALDTKLALSAGMAQIAYLAALTYHGGGRGHLLAFVGAETSAEPALTQAVNEALVFSGLEAGALDVGFFSASDTMSARLARVGLRFDLPQANMTASRTAPGSDPDRPPRLR
ncbi:MAG: SseB family protein [Arenibacterium sp.]